MEGLFLVLWALLLPADAAGGDAQPSGNLSCYGCFKVAEETLCTPTKCSPTDHVCVSHTLVTILKSRMILLVSKRCAPRCPNANVKYEWLSGINVLTRLTRQCCAGNLCNRAPAVPRGPWALNPGLLLPLGLLWAQL